MIFEVIDNKYDCFGYFFNGYISHNPPEEKEQHFCWTYNPVLDNYCNVEYVSLYCGGKTISEVCPEHLQEDWKYLNDKFKAFFRSFFLAKINLEENCYYDMVPLSFLVDYFSVKTKIIEYVVKTYKKPSNYEHLLEVMKVCNKIANQKLNVDTSVLDLKIANPVVKKAKVKYSNLSPYIKYDIFGTKTGRLSTISRSFPIHQLDKDFRNVIKPTNDWFLELDFNGAELRTFLALAGKPQPNIDIHDWNVENIFDGKYDREESKKKIFAWLYGETENKKAEEIYNKEQVRNKYWDGTKVTTYWGREIEADKHHSLSYIVQSTFADLVLKQMVKVCKLLEGYKSFISFTIHDNIIVDLADDEKHLLPQIVEVFSDTDLGKFLVNLKAGPNFGEMKKINYKQTI
jgi:hypothetical protein